MSSSEIADIRRQIDLEIEATNRAISGLATVASHEIINNKIARVWGYKEPLGNYMPPLEAAKIVLTALDKLESDQM